MNAELILLPCVIDTIDTAESVHHGGTSLLANRKEGRRRWRRWRRRRLEATVFSQTKACAMASVIECTRYGDKELVTRSLIDNDRSILYEDPRRDSNTSIEKKKSKIGNQENERGKGGGRWKEIEKKSRKVVVYPIIYVEIRERNQNFHLDRYASARIVVALVMHRSRCCVFFDNETGRTGQL